MEVLNAVFVAPFLDMADSPAFFFEVVIGGLLRVNYWIIRAKEPVIVVLCRLMLD